MPTENDQHWGRWTRREPVTDPAHAGHGSGPTVEGMEILNLVLPRRCGVCGVVGESVCGACRACLVRCGPPVCERCGSPGAWPVRRCAECAGRRLAFASARSALVYENRARSFVAAWKERGRRDLSIVAAELVCEVVGAPAADWITFVPGDRDRGLRRGHIPAAALATELSSRWSIPLSASLARRPGIERQRDLPRSERRRNVSSAFAATRPASGRVCLVDDVYTTGSTVTACATVLRASGAKSVEVVCLARAVR